MRRPTGLPAELERLRMYLKNAQDNVSTYQRAYDRLKKRYDALFNGITAVCARDRTFMLGFHKTNQDRDLMDVYHEFLYAYGRTCPNGCRYTRLSAPWWDDPQEPAPAPEPSQVQTVLAEPTEFLESLMEDTGDEAADLLTNEGEDLITKAREILGPKGDETNSNRPQEQV